jgi:hypothetical protein
MADCIVAEITHESAVQRKTHKKQARAWKHWEEYINKFIRNDDLFLKSFARHQQIKLIGAFALALREGWFSGPAHDKLVESTVSGTIQNVCATFRENIFPNPSFNEDARSGFILKQLYWAFHKADPAEKHQKAITICVIVKIRKKDSLRALDCHFPTCLPCNLLCMPILQISQSPSSRAGTNNNPLPPKHQILQRQQAH